MKHVKTGQLMALLSNDDKKRVKKLYPLEKAVQKADLYYLWKEVALHYIQKVLI